MTALLFDMVKVALATTGTGTTLTLGAADTGYQSFSGAGVPDGAVLGYGIEDGTAHEIGTLTYNQGAGTVTRTVEWSSTGSILNLTGGARLALLARAKDFLRPWVRKTTTYTATDGDRIQGDTSGGAWTMTLPASPRHSAEVEVLDPDGSWATNNLTIGLNSKTLRGNTGSTFVCNRSGKVRFIFDATEDKWTVTLERGV